MKKIAAIAVVWMIVSGIGIWFYMDGALKRAVEKVGTDILGTDVDIDELALDTSNRRVTMSGISVENPRGYVNDDIGTIASVTIDYETLTPQKIILKEMVIDGVHVNFELKHLGSNVTRVRDNVSNATQGNAGDKWPSVYIDALSIRNISITSMSAVTENPERKTSTMKDIYLVGIGNYERPPSVEEAARLVINEAVRRGASEGSAAELRGHVEEILRNTPALPFGAK